MSLDDPASPWVNEFPVRCHALGPTRSRYRYAPRLVPWLRAHRHEYDAVVVNGLWQYSSFGVWRAMRGTGTPYFVFTHGMLDPWFKRTYPIKHVKKWLYWPWAEYRVLRDAAAVLFTCEQERRLARRSFWLYKCEECVVDYGTHGPVGDPALQRERFLARFPQLQAKRCLLFLGRVHVKKGPDLLLHALAATLRNLPAAATGNLHLVMAGPDDHAYALAMKALAGSLGLEQRVTWTGMLTGDLKWGAFHMADAFVLPSHQENFGVAVVEALACGVPVLISSQVNIWEDIAQAGAGFVDADDIAGTQRLLERWARVDPERWRQMRAAAKICFARRFHVDGAAQSFIRVMELHGMVPASGN
jgi:glycosyltransferase involved in cell wall biosynthesis